MKENNPPPPPPSQPRTRLRAGHPPHTNSLPRLQLFVRSQNALYLLPLFLREETEIQKGGGGGYSCLRHTLSYSRTTVANTQIVKSKAALGLRKPRSLRARGVDDRLRMRNRRVFESPRPAKATGSISSSHAQSWLRWRWCRFCSLMGAPCQGQSAVPNAWPSHVRRTRRGERERGRD